MASKKSKQTKRRTRKKVNVVLLSARVNYLLEKVAELEPRITQPGFNVGGRMDSLEAAIARVSNDISAIKRQLNPPAPPPKCSVCKGPLLRIYPNVYGCCDSCLPWVSALGKGELPQMPLTVKHVYGQ